MSATVVARLVTPRSSTTRVVVQSHSQRLSPPPPPRFSFYFQLLASSNLAERRGGKKGRTIDWVRVVERLVLESAQGQATAKAGVASTPPTAGTGAASAPTASAAIPSAVTSSAAKKKASKKKTPTTSRSQASQNEKVGVVSKPSAAKTAAPAPTVASSGKKKASKKKTAAKPAKGGGGTAGGGSSAAPGEAAGEGGAGAEPSVGVAAAAGAVVGGPGRVFTSSTKVVRLFRFNQVDEIFLHCRVPQHVSMTRRVFWQLLSLSCWCERRFSRAYPMSLWNFTPPNVFATSQSPLGSSNSSQTIHESVRVVRT